MKKSGAVVRFAKPQEGQRRGIPRFEMALNVGRPGIREVCSYKSVLSFRTVAPLQGMPDSTKLWDRL